jgi:hypothetical protein
MRLLVAALTTIFSGSLFSTPTLAGATFCETSAADAGISPDAADRRLALAAFEPRTPDSGRSASTGHTGAAMVTARLRGADE